MKTTRDAIIARSPGSVTSYFTASATLAATLVEAERHEHLDRPAPAAESPEGADERAQHRRARNVARSRMEDQRESDGEDRIPDNARHVTEPVVHPSDRVEPLDADGRCDLAPLRVARELVDCGDLIEAGRPGEPRGGSIVAAFPGRA
jgi:hypothetical protein